MILINTLIYVMFMLCAVVRVNSIVAPVVKLNNNLEMPVIGLGTWQTEGQQVVNAVTDALEAGYRHIDTAWFYHNEKEVGIGLQNAIKKGWLQREDVFITTKVWPRNMNQRKSLDIIKNSLKELNTSYIDLVLMHFPLSSSRTTANVYNGLEDAFNQKIVHSIGVSNFKPKEIKELMKLTKIKPLVNQIRIHPGFNQNETIEFCKQNNITVTGYSPLSTGALLNDPTLLKIGATHKKSAAQVAIKWQIQKGLTVIPKSTKKNRIIENIDIFDFNLSEDQIKAIDLMPQKKMRDFWG